MHASTFCRVFLIISCALCIGIQGKQKAFLFDTFEQVKQFAESHEEYPPIDNSNWYDPDYTSFYKKMDPSWLRTLIIRLGLSKPLWSEFAFKDLLQKLTEERELNGYIGRFVQKIVPSENDQFIIFGSLGGAFHSFVRDLENLIQSNHIDKKLLITNAHYYVVINGKVASGSPYILETLTLIASLMEKNPKNTFFLRGEQEDKEFWQEGGLSRELEIKARHVSNESIPLAKLINRFFNTLPLALYLVGDNPEKDIVRISSWGFEAKELDESNFSAFFAEKDHGPNIFKINSQKTSGKKISLAAIIKNEGLDISYHKTNGLQTLGKEREATTWTVLSSPTGANRRLFTFFFDAFTILTTKKSIGTWTVQLCSRDVRDMTGFSCDAPYNLISGFVEKEETEQAVDKTEESKLKKQLHEAQEEIARLKSMPSKVPSQAEPSASSPSAVEEKVVAGAKTLPSIVNIGTSLDLSRGTKDLGKAISEVTTVFFNQFNEQKKVPPSIHYAVLDDEYDPVKTKENINSFITKFDTNIILSLSGSENFQACLDLIQQGKIATIFPIPGEPAGCPPDLKGCINFRPSYTQEAYALVLYLCEKFKIARAQDIILFYQDDSFGKACLKGAEQALSKSGIGNVADVEKIPYQRNALNFGKAVEAIKNSSAKFLGLFATPIAAQQLLSQTDPKTLAKTLFAISTISTNAFRDFIQKNNLKIIFSNIVPSPQKSDLPIVVEYSKLIAKTDIPSTQNSLEAYINAALLTDAIVKIAGPVTKEALLAVMEKDYADTTFQGLRLHFDPQSRTLSRSIWISEGGEDSRETQLTIPPMVSPSEKQGAPGAPAAAAVPAGKPVAPGAPPATAVPAGLASPSEIKIATSLDLTRGIKQLGIPLRDGMTMRLNELNNENGVNGLKVILDVLDDGYEPTLARENIETFIKNKTPILLSPLGDPTLERYRDLVEQKKVLVLYPCAGSLMFRTPELKYVVHILKSHFIEARTLVEYVHKQYKLTKYVLFYQDDAFGQGCLAGARAGLKKVGIEKWTEIPYKRNTSDFTLQVNIIKQDQPDAIAFLGTAVAAMNLIRQAGITTFHRKVLFGIHAIFETQFLQFLEQENIKLVISNSSLPNPQAKNIEIVRNFNAQAEKNNIQPSTLALEGYLAASFFIDLLQRLKGPVTMEGLLDLIENTKNYDLKGLRLNFNPQTREMLGTIWIMNEKKEWIEITPQD